MKNKFFSVIVLLVACTMFDNDMFAQEDNSNSLLRHIVTVTFKKDASADSIRMLDDTYLNLSKNSMVKDFEMGVNISMRDTGVIKHVYLTTFASKEDMSNYKKLPLYKDLFKISASVAADLAVVDYWAKK